MHFITKWSVVDGSLAGSPVVVEDLCKHPGMSVEEVLVQDGIVIGQGFGQAREPGGRNLLQRGLVGLMADATHIQNHSVLGIHIIHVHDGYE